MTRIKIIYYYSSTRLDTGSPRALLQVIDSLDRAKFTPVFIAIGDGQLAEAMRERNVEVIQSEVKSVTWKHPRELFAAIREKIRLLKKVGAGIVHLNEPGWNSDLVLAAQLSRIPVALHLHNPCEITVKNLNFLIASKVFICSKAQRHVISNFDRIRQKCVVLHNAIEIAPFATGHSIRSTIGLKENELVIGTIAQIRHGKGIDIFLDAAKRLLVDRQDLKFVIVGPGASNEQEYFQEIMARLTQGALKDKVIYLGSRSDIPDLLASFDVFCLATRAETFGIVVIEAMAAGVPVVASAVGGVPEIITDPALGVVVNDLNSDAFTSALNTVLEMGDERKLMGERGHQSLYGRFDLAHMRQTLAKAYGEMVS